MPKDTKTTLEVSTLVDGNEVKMKRYSDGAASFATRGGEHFIYFHSAQVEVMRSFLDAKLCTTD